MQMVYNWDFWQERRIIFNLRSHDAIGGVIYIELGLDWTIKCIKFIFLKKTFSSVWAIKKHEEKNPTTATQVKGCLIPTSR